MKDMRIFGRYAIVYVYDGSGFYEDTNGYVHDIIAGDLILVFPELGHRYGPQDEDWRELYYVFDGPLFDLWRKTGLLKSDEPILHLEPVDYWLRRWQSIAPQLDEVDPPLVELCRLQQVLAEALTATPSKQSQQREWCARACALLEADLRNAPELEQIAEQLGMTYATFRRRFQEQMQMSPGRYRAVRTIDLACEMMQRAEMTNREIADRLGFSDEFHFSKRFKQITGQTPTAYRTALP